MKKSKNKITASTKRQQQIIINSVNYKESNSGENIVKHIQTFCDVMGLINPLTSASTSHISIMSYFVILDLPSSYYADFWHIHLIFMCNSNGLKKRIGWILEMNADEGWPVLKLINGWINEDLSDLEKKFKFTFHHKKSEFFILSESTGDDLAPNQLFGMTESFSQNFSVHCVTVHRREPDQVHWAEVCLPKQSFLWFGYRKSAI